MATKECNQCHANKPLVAFKGIKVAERSRCDTCVTVGTKHRKKKKKI